MTEFTVQITSLPLGVRSAKLNEQLIGVDYVDSDSLGAKLGLMSGDLLVAINDNTLSTTKMNKGTSHTADIEALLKRHSLPFTATFRRHCGSISPRSPELITMDIVEDQNKNSSTINEEKFDRLSSNYSGGDSEDSVSQLSLSGDVQLVAAVAQHRQTQNVQNPLNAQNPQNAPNPQKQKPHRTQHTEQESLSTIALRSFGEVVMFQSGDLDLADFASKRSTVRQMVHSEPVGKDHEMPTTAMRHCPWSTPLLNLAATDSQGFVYLEDVDSGRSVMDVVVHYDDIDPNTKALVDGFCRRHRLQLDAVNHNDAEQVARADQHRAISELVSQYVFDHSVMFDVSAQIASRDVHVSSNGFKYGMHEWNIKVREPDDALQQIGVISSCDMDSLQMAGSNPPRFKLVAQSLFTQSGSRVFYASYNGDGSSRCVKNLSKRYPKGLREGDVVTVRLNLTKGHPKVSYYLNGERVRKVMSMEMNKTYFPVIVCSGKGVYELVDYQ